MPRSLRDPDADADVAAIAEYIGEENQNPAAARRFIDDLNKKFHFHAEQPEMGELRGANCITSGDGCKKGGCTFGAEHAIDRLV